MALVHISSVLPELTAEQILEVQRRHGFHIMKARRFLYREHLIRELAKREFSAAELQAVLLAMLSGTHL